MRFDALPVLNTQRLLLRPITMDDAADMFAYAKDPQVSKLLEWNPIASIEEEREYIKSVIDSYKNNQTAPWGIIDKISNKVIGTIEVRNYKPGHLQVELGYCLSRDYWGKGLMVEAIEQVLEYLFTKTTIEEVTAFVRIDNIQSQRVLEKVGMHKTNVRKCQNIKGIMIDLDQWGIRKKEKL